MKEIVLALVQGLTEFLPVSSSGHLVVAQSLLGINRPGIGLEVLLHLGTAVAIIVYFRKDMRRYLDIKTPLKGNLLFLVFLGSIPAGVVGFLLGDSVERLFESTFAVSLLFIFNGIFLISTVLVKNRKGEDGGKEAFLIGPLRAFLVGLAQAIAILPGISRSGSTIGLGLFLGVPTIEAFKFSFLLALPAICGAALLELLKGAFVLSGWDIVAFFVALGSGILALGILRWMVSGRRLFYFGLYTLFLGVILLAFRS